MATRRRGTYDISLFATIAFLAILFMGGVSSEAYAFQPDYLGLELGATWSYAVSEQEKELENRTERAGTMTRQVMAVETDVEASRTTYTIRETWNTSDGTRYREYDLVKVSETYYALRDGEMVLVLKTPLEKLSQSEFSLAFWQGWNLYFGGQVKRATPFGEVNAWLGKEWRDYDDGSYVELTLEFVPYLGYIREAKLERISPDGCS